MAIEKNDDWKAEIAQFNYLIDPNKSEIENLLLYLNKSNDTDYVDTDFVIGPPIKTRDSGVTMKNFNTDVTTDSKVMFSALPSSGYKGSDYFHYRRIDIYIQWNLHNKNRIAIPDTITEEDAILDFINVRMPFVPGSLTATLETINGVDMVIIKAKSDSYLYTGEIRLPRTYTSTLPGLLYHVPD